LEFVVEVIRSLFYTKWGAIEVLNGEVFAASAKDLTSIEQEGFVLLFIKGVPVDLEIPSSASMV
jgi:hypothetical protein